MKKGNNEIKSFVEAPKRLMKSIDDDLVELNGSRARYFGKSRDFHRCGNVGECRQFPS